MKIFATHINFRQSIYSGTRWPGFESQLWCLLALIPEQVTTFPCLIFYIWMLTKSE